MAKVMMWSGPIGWVNDLWIHNLSSNQWMWVAGTNSTNIGGVYYTKGIAAPTNISTGSLYTTPTLTTGSTPTVYNYYSSTTGCTTVYLTLVLVTVNPNPLVSISSSNSLKCVGQSATITATGDNSYLGQAAEPILLMLYHLAQTLLKLLMQ